MDRIRPRNAGAVSDETTRQWVARARALMGADFWSYGLAGNERTLEAFLGYHHAQGLSPRRVEVAELFHPATLEAFSL